MDNMNKKNYEVMFISKKALGEDGFSVVSGLVAECITKLGGEVTKNMEWGRRKFAYPINKEVEGFYRVLNFEFDPKKVSSLKEKLNLIEGVLRYMITSIEERK
jgi:small subunit ribosomal protein S6